MKVFKLSLLVASLTFIGCGGGSNDTITPSSHNTNEVKTVQEAQKSLNAFSAFQSINLSVVNTSSASGSTNVANTKMLSKLQKTATAACDDGGSLTLDVSDDEKSATYTFAQCKNGSEYIDGTMKLLQNDDTSYELTYDKLTYKGTSGEQYMDLTMKVVEEASIYSMTMNGVINQTTTAGEINNMTITDFKIKGKDTSDESWTTIDGKMAFETKCITGTYTFETVEKLVDAKDGSDNLESGILKLNGATYTFENPNVTIEAGSESETILQSELEKRMESADSCDI
ncbi:MAG TPA: hypothetical protein ENK94_02200 [Campylobacterales bacterium]|nr:hypothetical protein [Campylobacterales bacterium]